MADEITLITYEDFEKNINDIRTLRKFQSSLNSVFDEYNRKKGDCTTLWFPSLENNLIDLLEKKLTIRMNGSGIGFMSLISGGSTAKGVLKLTINSLCC